MHACSRGGVVHACSRGMHACSGGVAWLGVHRFSRGSMCGCSGGGYMVALGGEDMCGCLEACIVTLGACVVASGGHAWLLWGCMVTLGG